MPDTKITNLTSGGTGQAADEFPINRGGLDRKLSITNIYDYLKTIFTTADVASSANKRYLTDAQLVVVGNTSGTNTGDQVNITGNAATVTTNANLTGPITSVGNATSVANGAISAAAMISNSIVTYAKIQDVSATNRVLGRATAGAGVTEEITVGGDISQVGSNFNIGNNKILTALILNSNVTYAKIQDVSATNRLLGRSTAGAGVVEEITVGGDLTQSGSNLNIGNNKVVTAHILANNVTNAKLAQMAAHTFKGNNTGGTSDPLDLSIANMQSELGIPTSKVIGLSFIIDGGGSAITTGVKGFLEIPFDMTITGWTIMGDQSGSIVVDVWKDTYANFPPTVADTIAGSEKPTISATTKGQDLTLSTWTTAVTAGDILGFNVDSITTLTRVTLSIRGTKS